MEENLMAITLNMRCFIKVEFNIQFCLYPCNILLFVQVFITVKKKMETEHLNDFAKTFYQTILKSKSIEV